MTLQELADRAGVSKSTVSRALRDHPRIGRETCRRIQALAGTSGYRPDPLIATWINRRWNRKGAEIETIAWLSTFPDKRWMGAASPYINAVHEGAAARARARGYLLELFWLHGPGMTAKRMSQILSSRGIRGVCLAPLLKGRSHLNLKWDDFACAAVGHTLVRPELHRASSNQLQGIQAALRGLRRSGYRRTGVCIGRDVNLKVNFNWMAGVLLAQAQRRKGEVALLVCDPRTGEAEFNAWLAEARPDVLLVSSDFMAKWLRRVEVSVPMAVLAWHEGCGYPGLDQKPFEVGEAAVDLIIGQLQRNETGIPRVPRVTMVHGEWRERAEAADTVL